MRKLFACIAVLCCISLPEAWGKGSLSAASETEYRKMLERLNERYQDYFIHQQEQKRFEASRQKGRASVRQERTQEQKASESARLEYVRQRRKVPDDTPLRLAWESLQRQELKEKEKSRVEYTRKIRRLREVEKSTRQIPPEIESGLIPSFE